MRNRSIPVIPGTAHLGKEASAKAAAMEKKIAGELRNVEHIALHDDEEEEVVFAEAQKASKKRRVSPSTSPTSKKREYSAEVATPGGSPDIDHILALEFKSES